MKIGVIGINGFLGNAIAATARQQGHTVIGISLTRTQEIKNATYIQQLLTPLSLDALIHTAVSRHPKTDLEAYVNTDLPSQLESLFRSINGDGIFIHISSINVLVSSLQDRYTQQKRQAEQNLSGSKAIIIRPSLIWSWQGVGDAQRLEQHIAHKLFAPMLYPSNTHLPILVDALAEKIIDLIKDDHKGKTFHMVGDTPCRLWDLAKCISSKYHTTLIPVPTLPDWLFLPKIVRTINYTRFEYSSFPKPNEVIILPFKFS